MSRGKQKWRRRQEKLRQAAAALDQQTPESAGEGAPSNLRPSEELGLVGRAIREEWPVTDAVKSETIATVQRIMAKAEEAYPETALAAADKLIRMTALNVAARKADQPPPPPQPSPAQKHLHQHLHVTRDNGDVNLVLYDYGGAKEPRRYPINELYADRRKADAARIEIAKKRLQEFADQVGALSAATQ